MIVLLMELIDHMKSKEDVCFEPMGAFVERWRAANPLPDWLATRPVHPREGGR